MKSLRLIIAVFLLSTTASFGQSIFGNWIAEYPGEDGQTTKVEIIFKSDRTYTVDFGMDNKIEVNGAFTFSETQMTIWDTSGEFACPTEAKGVYSYTVTQEEMIMTQISDDCKDRGGSGKMVFKKG
ncbi:MAG: hypothetical protein AAGH79_06390 [Bacteroidota bacterium]